MNGRAAPTGLREQARPERVALIGRVALRAVALDAVVLSEAILIDAAPSEVAPSQLSRIAVAQCAR